ncbi:MAG TPA: 2-dehydropantoate 2-reductase [Rectinemataceae bacterium]
MSGSRGIRSALIVGAGAIGAALASRLYDSDPDSVFICASGERKARYERDGFSVNGASYSFRIAEPARAPFDLVIFAVKDYDLETAIHEASAYIGPDTSVLSLLNGLESETRLRAAFGAGNVPLGFIIRIDAMRIGTSVTFADIGEIRFGWEKNDPKRLEPRVMAIADFLSAHGMPYSVPEDMVRALWFKFMINVAVNQWSALLRGDYGFFQRSPSARLLLRKTMEEVLELSRALGTGLGEADIEQVFLTLGSLPPGGKTSMLQDVEAGRKTEVEAFSGAVIRLAAAAGLRAPMNETLYSALRAIEESAARPNGS